MRGFGDLREDKRLVPAVQKLAAEKLTRVFAGEQGVMVTQEEAACIVEMISWVMNELGVEVDVMPILPAPKALQ
jgi:hypothetical protein